MLTRQRECGRGDDNFCGVTARSGADPAGTRPMTLRRAQNGEPGWRDPGGSARLAGLDRSGCASTAQNSPAGSRFTEEMRERKPRQGRRVLVWIGTPLRGHGRKQRFTANQHGRISHGHGEPDWELRRNDKTGARNLPVLFTAILVSMRFLEFTIIIHVGFSFSNACRGAC